MPRKLNFADGFESSTEPVQGNITADNLVCYPDDAAYEAVVLNSPQCGNIYRNETTGKIRYYDEVAGVWKDQDEDAFVAINAIEAEQDAQDILIAQNATDIAANTTEIALVNARSNHDRNIYLISDGEVSHPVLGDITFPADTFLQLAGSPNDANEIAAQTISLLDNEVAYIDINRGVTPTTRLVMVTSIDTLVETNDTLVIARRVNDDIHVGVNSGIRLAVGESSKLTAGISSGGAGGGTFEVFGSGCLEVVDNPAAGPTETPFDNGFNVATAFDPINAINTIGHDVQSFTTVSAIDLDKIVIEMAKAASDNIPVGADVTVTVVADTGGGFPDFGTVLGTSAPALQTTGSGTTIQSIPTDYNFTGVSLAAATRYWFYMEAASIPFNSTTNNIRSKRYNTNVGGELRVTHDGTSYGAIAGALPARVEGTTAGGGVSTIDLISDEDVFIQYPGFLDDRNRILPQTIAFPDNNSVAYVELNTTSDVATDLAVTVDTIDNVTDQYIIARRFDDKIYFGPKDSVVLSIGKKISLDKETQPLQAYNYFRNSKFEILQRGASFSGVSGTNPYTADGWQTGGQVGSGSFNTINSAAAFAARLSKEGTGTTTCSLLHKIGVRDMNNFQVGDTISVKFKANNETPGVDAFAQVEFFTAGGVDSFVSANLKSTVTSSTALPVSNSAGDYAEFHATYVLGVDDINNGIMLRIGSVSTNASDLYTMNLKEPHLYAGDEPKVQFQPRGNTVNEEWEDAKRYMQLISNVKGMHITGTFFATGTLDTLMRATPVVTSYNAITKAQGNGLHVSIPGLYANTAASFNAAVAILSVKTFYLQLTGYAATTNGATGDIALVQNNAVFIQLIAEY